MRHDRKRGTFRQFNLIWLQKIVISFPHDVILHLLSLVSFHNLLFEYCRFFSEGWQYFALSVIWIAI